MISLNLNSPEQKKEIRLKRFYFLLKNSLGFMSTVLLFCSIILLLAKNDLQLSYNQIVADSSLINQQIRGSNQKVNVINKQIAGLAEVQKQFIPWSNILVYLTKNLPANIKISFLIIQPTTDGETGRYQLTLKGLAKHRDDFLTLKDQLSATNVFTEITAPISQLTTKENIDFEIKAIIKLNREKQ